MIMKPTKKHTKLTLSEVETQMEVLTKEEMHILKGGGNGTIEDPYTWAEYESLLNDPSFIGGWVIDEMGSSFYGLGQVELGSEHPPQNEEPLPPFFHFPDYGSHNNNEWEGTMYDNNTPENDNWGSSYHYGSYYYDNQENENLQENQEGIYEYGGSSGDTDIITPIKDGININSGNFTFNTQKNEVFHKQLTDILSTNKIIKELLGYFENGVVHLTFDINDLEEKTFAQTIYPSTESYHIVFNSQMIDENGWNYAYKGKDNIGFDHSKAQNTDERIIIILTHEAMHAKYRAIYEDAFREAQKISLYKDPYPEDIVNHLFNNGYSQEFIEIFFIKRNGEWRYNENEKSDKTHEYMRKHNHSVIDKALEEYRKDRSL